MNEKFLDYFRTAIINFSHISTIPINDKILEEIVHNSLILSGEKSDWKEGSHLSGKDINQFSIKGGKFTSKNILTINCARTTKYKTLEEKIQHFDSNNFNYYFCFTRKEKKNIGREYQLIVIDANDIKLSKLNWIKTHKYIGNGTFGITAKIEPKMSDQIWLNIDINIFKKYKKLITLNFPYSEIGKNFNVLFNKNI